MKISKNLSNLEIAELLRAVAAAYQLKDQEKNRFRIIAYQRAGDAIEHLSSEAKDLWDEGKLEEVAGIGPNIAKHLDEIFRIGQSKHFQSIMKDLPPAMFELMSVPGIGPKTAFKLTKELKITSAKGAIKKLQKAIKQGKVSGLSGFGEQSQASLKKSITEVKSKGEMRMLLPRAMNIASEVIEWLKKSPAVKQAEPLGSLRRMAATIGDIDIAVSTNEPLKVIDHFAKFPDKKRILGKGAAMASIIVPPKIQIDILVQSPNSFGALLQHFTGSKHHNIALREHALKKGLSLSQHGIKDKKSGKLSKYPTEEGFYKKLGMDWIPPELREDSGEIETALNHNLPDLVELKDIKSDLQIHSDFNIETSHDLGQSSMEEIIAKANQLGYEYLAFTEHNPSKSGHNDQQMVDLLKRKQEKVLQLNELLRKGPRIKVKKRTVKRNELKNTSFEKSENCSIKKVFNSLEIDILPDGTLPLSEKALEVLDFALVSIHSSFRLNRNQMTQRVLKALEYPKVKIFAHPTARKINHREGVELEWPKIFEVCKKRDIWLEINADPIRLDLPDVLIKEAIKVGVKLTLGTDAHHQDALDNMPYGVAVARRGWATKKDIITTKSLTEFEKLL